MLSNLEFLELQRDPQECAQAVLTFGKTEARVGRHHVVPKVVVNSSPKVKVLPEGQVVVPFFPVRGHQICLWFGIQRWCRSGYSRRLGG